MSETTAPLSRSRWWLISDKTYRVISVTLENLLDELPESKAKEEIRQALHQLDTGLHVTDSIPEDYKKDEEGV